MAIRPAQRGPGSLSLPRRSAREGAGGRGRWPRRRSGGLSLRGRPRRLALLGGCLLLLLRPGSRLLLAGRLRRRLLRGRMRLWLALCFWLRLRLRFRLNCGGLFAGGLGRGRGVGLVRRQRLRRLGRRLIALHILRWNALAHTRHTFWKQFLALAGKLFLFIQMENIKLV